MTVPFIVPYLINEYALKVEDLWGDSDTTGMNLFNHWYNISLQQVILFQRNSYDHCVWYEDIVSCECTLEFFMKYFYGSFNKSIEGKYDTLDKLKQCRIIYLKILFYDMFNMSNVIITSLHYFIKNFPSMGFPRFKIKKIGSDSSNECCMWALILS